MAAKIVRSRRIWNRQPPRPTRIDQQNPITRGLVLAYTPSMARREAVYQDVIGAYGSGVSLPSSAPGQALRFSGGQATGAASYGTGYSRLVGAKALTVELLVNLSSVASGKLLAKWGVTNNNLLLVEISSSGKLGFIVGDTSQNRNSAATSNTVLTASALTHIIWTFDSALNGGGFGVGHTVEVNGISQAVSNYADANAGTVSGTYAATGMPSAASTAFQLGVANDGTPMTGDMFLCNIWTRALRPEERAARYRDPWANFSPARRTVFLPTAGPVAITGNQGTWAAGNVVGSTATSVALTGNQGAWSPGNVAAQTASSLALSGVQGTWTPGSVVPSVSATLALNGVAGNWSAGTVVAGTASSLALSGVQGSWAAGSVSPTVDAIRALTGLQGSWGIGTVAPQTASSFALSGNQGTWGAGSVSGSTATSVALSGNQGTWGAGTVSPAGSTALALSGNVATWAPGAVSPSISATRALTGAQGTWSVGNVSPAGSTALALSGVQATWQAGSVAGSTATSAALTGVQGSWGAGNVAPIAGTALALSGNQSAWAAGSVKVSAAVRLTGVQASWSAGMVAVVGDGIAETIGSLRGSRGTFDPMRIPSLQLGERRYSVKKSPYRRS